MMQRPALFSYPLSTALVPAALVPAVLVPAILVPAVLLFTASIFTSKAFAHEVRPSYLNITQTAPQAFDVLWKQPMVNGKRLKLNPRYPEDCREENASTSLSRGVVFHRSTLHCDLSTGDIAIDGLERTLADVFVEIMYHDRPHIRTLLRPGARSFTLGSDPSTGFTDYVRLGVEHIVFGWDHILFVIGLTLLVSFRQIWAVATSFTIAHSVTLALIASGRLNIPIRPVEILIALSIVILGMEILRKDKGLSSAVTRHPYIVSFLIGLVHGCGFASAFGALDGSQNGRIATILPFNLGIELGQFAVIAVMSFAVFAISRKSVRLAGLLRLLTVYAISGIAVFWVLERTAFYVT